MPSAKPEPFNSATAVRNFIARSLAELLRLADFSFGDSSLRGSACETFPLKRLARNANGLASVL